MQFYLYLFLYFQLLSLLGILARNQDVLEIIDLYTVFIDLRQRHREREREHGCAMIILVKLLYKTDMFFGFLFRCVAMFFFLPVH